MATASLVLLILLAAVALPAHADSTAPFFIFGKVYCDTCRCGFETSATIYIPKAKVRLVCKDSVTMVKKFETDAETDSTGTYKIKVNRDHHDDLCSVVLVSSPMEGCGEPDKGRSKAPAILTGSNGAVSNVHYTNAMGFLKDKPLPGCRALLKYYLLDGDARTF